jgi:antitoxin Phd
LQDAKNRLSQVVANACNERPHTITLRGRPAPVVVSSEKYLRLTQPSSSLIEFLRRSPLRAMDRQIERSRDAGREIDL